MNLFTRLLLDELEVGLLFLNRNETNVTVSVPGIDDDRL